MTSAETQSLNEELARARALAGAYVGGMEALTPDDREAGFDEELQALRSVAAIAELGLAATSDASKQNALDRIEKICDAWQQRGYSRSFLKVKADCALDAMEPASDAVN